MIVEHVFEGMGKGLLATAPISNSTTLFEERPLVSIQYSWNKKYKYLACDECMRPLENAEENLRRLTANKSLSIPHKELCIILATQIQIIKCENCEVLYCSPECREIAFNKYHKVMCINGGYISKQFMESFEQLWNSIHYPPESSNLMILVKMVAMVVQSDHRKELIDTFNGFCQSTAEETGQMVHKILDKKYTKQLMSLFKMFKDNLHKDETADMGHWFTMDGFLGLVALVCRNSQGIATSSFALWMKEAESRFESDARFDEFVSEIYDQIENHVGEFIDNEGIGLYTKQSLLNHSCEPNCEVKFSGADSTLNVVALRDILPGEQLYISYLDRCQLERSRHSRRSHLRQFYLFDCRCQKCERQSGDPDETSEEEDDEEDCEMME